MSTQLDHWTGEFGREYLERNQVDPATRVDWFRRTLRPLGLASACEIGANKGHNLIAIERALGQRVITQGVEPSADARAQAHGVAVMEGTVYDIELLTDSYDLVLSSGLLIHIPDERLDDALREMHRVARRFLLAIEYHAEQDTEVEYRGLDGMLWRRDYGAHYLRLFPSLRVRASGDLTEADGFAGARFWLLEKTQRLEEK